MLKALKCMDSELLLRAFEITPSLIVDCGNAADPHQLFPHIREELLHQVYIINAEAIYRFRDALRKLPYWINKLKIRQVVITTTHTLFSYDDEIENNNVLEQCWELMKDISKECPVTVGISGKMHEDFAEAFADRSEG
jgi:hypothetical protein